MSDQPKVPLTQRAYTLRLRRAPGKCWREGCGQDDCGCWRDALWATHEAVNKGARAFGDWLLTLRGGLDHALASGSRARERRIVLALGWVSVEDAVHAPSAFRVASGEESQQLRDKKVIAALREILRKRAITEIEEWVDECRPSLTSAIREDAVWVNRSAAFDAALDSLDGLTRAQAKQALEYFVGDVQKFLSLEAGDKDGNTEGEEGGNDSKDYVKKACGWLSFNCGEDKKGDPKRIAESLERVARLSFDDCVGECGTRLIERVASTIGVSPANLDAIRGTIGWKPGPASKGLKALREASKKEQVSDGDIARLRTKLREEAQDRRKRVGEAPVPWAGVLKTKIEREVGFEYSKNRFGVMLDHALRRFSSNHSWMKRAEVSRRKFDEDAATLNTLRQTFPVAVEWLDQLCVLQSAVTGASTEAGYQIRKRALGGKSAKAWKTVVQAWSQADCTTEEDRIEAVREVQKSWDDEDEKFGHADLFEKLAGEDAACVWKPNETVNAQVLIDYVAARTADRDRQRYKVPMYRHPDALAHPIFCDFGNSRWSIRYALLKSHAGHKVSLQMVADGRVGSKEFFWASKRLNQDLPAPNYETKPDCRSKVSRGNRLGIAAGTGGQTIEALSVFEEEHWNGRLQASRRELEAIARWERKGDERKANAARGRLHWLLTFSPRLQPQGPWLDYARRFESETGKSLLSIRGKEVETVAAKEKDEWRGLAYPIWHPSNEKGRVGLSKHVLSRLPGLRNLSVDLGHRFAAACAVWETLTGDRFREEMASARAKEGEGWTVEESDVYARVLEPERESNRATKRARQEKRVKKFRPATVYRRIGSDTLADGTPHPAPWARLERQFVIKLQGEERPARAASKDEVERVTQFAKRHGLATEAEDKGGRGVDGMMARAVGVATLALRRHARCAKIAWAMDPNTRSVFGIGGRQTAFEAGDATNIKLLTDALFDWHALASEAKWDDPLARESWNEYIGPIQADMRIDEPQRGPDTLDDRTRQQRRKDDDALRERLEPIAKRLVEADRAGLHAAWLKRWRDEDGSPASNFEHSTVTDEKGRQHGRTKPTISATGWHAELRWLTDWIMGRQLAGATSKLWTRNVGGLSLTRIATMQDLYRLHKQFAMRPRPDKPSGAPEKGESNAGVAQSTLDALKRMRDQRSKQLASRIAEAALGIGSENRKKHWSGKNHSLRPRRRLDSTDGSGGAQGDSRFAPCHAVVIERLDDYKPDEVRGRRENRMIAAWRKAEFKKRLAEACQLHGLHLRQIAPHYTSRQDSRTGMPGVRCDDVPVTEFLTAPWWKKQVMQAKKKSASERSEREKFLLKVHDAWSNASDGKRKVQKDQVVRIPVKGGPLFVSAATGSAIQADLNAAANIGLKALMDPDWTGRWWYIPCSTKDSKPSKDKVGGCAIISCDNPLQAMPTAADHEAPTKPPVKSRAGKGKASKGQKPPREVVNYWRDPSSGTALPNTDWQQTKVYWRGVEERILNHLRANSDRQNTVEPCPY